MFKTVLKISLLSFLLVLSISTVNADSKVSAATRCPTSHQDAQNTLSWGITPQQNGQHGNDMAGLIIHAWDASNGTELNAPYHLRSAFPDANNLYKNPNPGIAGNGATINLNEKIYQDFQGVFSNSTQDYESQTGGIIWDTRGNNLDSFHCSGWDAYAPIDPFIEAGRIGNSYVLDCGLQNKSRFWFSSIDKPLNDGANGRYGHWSVDITSAQSGNIHIDNFDNNSMGFSGVNKYFNVKNGTNTFVNFVWHPDSPPTPQPPSQDCSTATINPEQGYIKYITIRGTNHDNDLSNVEVDPGGSPRTFTYQAVSADVTIKRVYYNNRGSPQSPNWQYDHENTQTIHCYHATCYVQEVYDRFGRAGGTIHANEPFSVKVEFWNDNPYPERSPIPANVAGYDFSMTELAENGHDYRRNSVGYGLNYGLAASDSGTVIIPQAAPGSAQNFNLNFYPAMDNGDGGELPRPIGGGSGASTCSKSVPIYQQFTVKLGGDPVNLVPSVENPTNVTYKTAITEVSGGPVNVPTRAEFYKLAADGVTKTSLASASGTHTYTAGNILAGNYTIPGTINAGERYCLTGHADYTKGYVGPGGPGDVIPDLTTSDDYNPTCPKIVNQPYAHFFGNDVTAGGGFGNAGCQKTSTGAIYAYNNKASGKGGSGTQFGAHAMDVISGLGSASLRTLTPLGLSGLSFANTEHIGGSAPDQTTGGYLGDSALNNFCVPDYFGDKPALLSTNPDVPLTENKTAPSATAGSGASKQWYKPASGTLILNSGTIANTVNQTIFVDGNVVIRGDGIKYSTDTRGSVKSIPSFYLVVKNGNIRIEPSVTQLDGVYVAQPVDPNVTQLNGVTIPQPDTTNKTGIINTCYISNVNDVYRLCKNQLVVNGAFVANRILLARSYSSLRYSQPGEYYVPITSPTQPQHSCGNVNYDVPTPSTASAADCAAEVFNFSPELYMSQPALNARFGPTSEKYDAITSLSPVL